MLINREVTSVELVSFYAKRCYEIGRKLNLLTGEYYKEALAIAKIKDQILDEAIKAGTTEKLGLLHGIPMSIKDHVSSTSQLTLHR